MPITVISAVASVTPSAGTLVIALAARTTAF
jgi:hypothetical protein